MSIVKSNRAESMVDLVIRGYGHIEGIIQFAKDNGVALDAVETGVVQRLVNDSLKAQLRTERPLFPQVFTVLRTQVSVSSGQNNIDLALQELGSVEGFVAFLKANGIGANDDIAHSTIIKSLTADIVNDDVRKFYKALNYRVNTGVPVESTPDGVRLLEDGSFRLLEDGSFRLLE